MIADFFSKENVSFVLSIFAAIGTALSTIYIVLANRRKITLTVVSSATNGDEKSFCMMFENKSRLPISITRIMLVSNNDTVDCVPTPKMVVEKIRSKNNVEFERTQSFSADLPIVLEPLAAKTVNLCFEKLPQAFQSRSKQEIFLIHTTRGKIKQFEVQLPEADFYHYHN